MPDLNKTIGGIFGLILLYLILKNSKELNNLISSAGSVTNRGVAALQGR